MGIHHHAFNCKHYIFTVFLALCLVLVSQVAVAQSSAFVVEGVTVDVTAEDSVAAQEQAYAKAQAQAFHILAQRIVDDRQTIEYPGFETVASLVRDYEITDEKISSVRYVGTYTFRFREKAVSKFFSVSGVNYTAQSSRPLLVLPIFQIDGTNTIWAENNLWMKAWANSRVTGGLVPVEVPLGDLMDIADIDDSNPLRYERSKLDRMLERYNASEAAIMIAVPDMVLSAVADDNNRAVGRLRISIYRTDRANAEYVSDIIVEAGENENRSALYDRAVLKAYGALQTDWKKQTVASIAQTAIYHVRVPLKNLKQWVDIRRSLGQVSALSELTILSMKRKEVRASFKFRGDEEHLRNALSRTPLSLSQPMQNPSAHNFTENGRAAPSVLYDLYYGSSYKKTNAHQLNNVQPASGMPQTQSGDMQSGVQTF